jgi:CRP/FNR family transcriptional regulator, cyclic AMP receptor protein
MSKREGTTAFTAHAFLDGLNERHRALLTAAAKPFSAESGEIFAREGDPAHAFYLIQEGHVALDLHMPDRGIVPIQSIAPGEAVGWSWLIPPHRWQFDCRAIDDVRGLSFDAQWLRHQCEQDHELGYFLLKKLLTVVAKRLAATRLQLLDIYK